MKTKGFPPLHPGEVLLEEFPKPMGLSQHKLALRLRVSSQKVNDIIRGKRGITADIALRLALVLGTSAEFWAGLQSDYELETARDALGDRLDKEVIRLNG